MAHKFAQKWTSYLFIGDRLQPNGTMDLRNMDNDGNLDNGDHDHNGHAKLTGKATGNTHLSLDSASPITVNYEGDLLHDSSNRMIIVGQKHYPKLPEADKERSVTLGQEDPPWILTKP